MNEQTEYPTTVSISLDINGKLISFNTSTGGRSFSEMEKLLFVTGADMVLITKPSRDYLKKMDVAKLSENSLERYLEYSLSE